MASKLTKWINAQLKAKGKSSKAAQKDAGKYSSIAAAKKAGSLYYTDKKGRVMIAAYAEDLDKPIKESKPTPTKRSEVKETKVILNSKTPDESNEGVIIIRAQAGPSKVRGPKAFTETEQKINDLKQKIAGLTIKRAETRVADRKNIQEKLDAAKTKMADQLSLDKALGMGNTTEEARDKSRGLSVKVSENLIDRKSDLIKQELKKGYKKGVATKRAKGGLIDMRKKGLFK